MIRNSPKLIRGKVAVNRYPPAPDVPGHVPSKPMQPAVRLQRVFYYLVLLAHNSKRQLHDFAILSLWGFRQLIRWSVRGPVSCNPKINLEDALFRVASFDFSSSPFDMRVIPADIVALTYRAGWCDWLPGVFHNSNSLQYLTRSSLRSNTMSI